jgi:hypothetical protein
MSSLADDITALTDLGISLERATELAVADRNKVSAPGNFHRIFSMYISLLLSSLLLLLSSSLLLLLFCIITNQNQLTIYYII